MSDNIDKYVTINKLIKMGMLIPFDENIELYHGRAREQGEAEWFVNPGFDNAGNNTNNGNIMGIPCLCVASKNIAEKYAHCRTAGGLFGEGSVHRIIPIQRGFYIFNENFNSQNLDEKQKFKFKNFCVN